MHDIDKFNEYLPLIKILMRWSISVLGYGLALWVLAMVVMWWLAVITQALTKRSKDVPPR
jgi:hypothetical protein